MVETFGNTMQNEVAAMSNDALDFEDINSNRAGI
jgi:hypothetical protein